MARDTNGKRSRHVCVVGVQWGDEGKGKVVDVLTRECDVVVRYQGGANAGHTVKIGDLEYVLHLIPSGILQEGKTCVIGNGVVVDPEALIHELDELASTGVQREESLWISDRAHVVMPYHRSLDAAREKSSGHKRIGTTLRGIGPCYTDKAARLGIRMADLVRADRFKEILARNLELKNLELRAIYGEEPIDFAKTYEEYRRHAERLAPRVRDISVLLEEEERRGAVMLFEGAQGTLLDVDLGTYPFVTSSNTSFFGLGPGTGFSPRRVATVLGITKAYTTRVGEGPFPTELEGPEGERLRQVGGEYGATTGRPRRCGWIDLVAIRRAVRIGDVDALVITKLDVLDELDEIRAAVAYRRSGEESGDFPAILDPAIEPVYRSFPGWKQSTVKCRSFGDLPQATRDYLQFIADESGCPISLVSVGKERSEVIPLEPWLVPRPSAESRSTGRGSGAKR